MESKGYYDVQDGRLVWVYYPVMAPDITSAWVMTSMGGLDVVDQVRDNEGGSRLDLERLTTALSSVG